jgi:hypothetical protein
VISGTTIAGHVDNVLRLQELCKQHDIWLHLRGHSLAALAMVSVQNVVSSILISVSCTSFIINSHYIYVLVVFSQLELLIASRSLLGFGLVFQLFLWLYPLIFIILMASHKDKRNCSSKWETANHMQFVHLKILVMGFDVMLLCGRILTFQRTMLPPSSGIMEALWFFKMLVSFHITTFCQNPEVHELGFFP